MTMRDDGVWGQDPCCEECQGPPKLYSGCCGRPLLYDTEPCPACKQCNSCGGFITDEAAFCKRGCCGDELRAFCSPECFSEWHAPDPVEF